MSALAFVLTVVIPGALLFWFAYKLVAWFCEAYISAFGTKESQAMLLAGRASIAAKIGAVLAVARNKPVQAPAELPGTSPELKAELDRLERLRIKKQILEVERDIEKMSAPGCSETAGEPKEPAVVAAPTLTVAAAAAAATAQPVPAPADQGLAQETEEDTTIIRDPATGEIIVA